MIHCNDIPKGDLVQTGTRSIHVKVLYDYTEFKLCQTEYINRVICQAIDTKQVSVRYPPKRQ